MFSLRHKSGAVLGRYAREVDALDTAAGLRMLRGAAACEGLELLDADGQLIASGRAILTRWRGTPAGAPAPRQARPQLRGKAARRQRCREKRVATGPA